MVLLFSEEAAHEDGDDFKRLCGEYEKLDFDAEKCEAAERGIDGREWARQTLLCELRC